MDDLVIAQWGGLGVVLIACAIAINRMYRDMLSERKEHAAEIKLLNEQHNAATKVMSEQHAAAVSKVQNERMEQTLGTTDRLMALQSKFSDATAVMGKEMRERVLAEDQVLNLLQTFERRLEAIDRRLDNLKVPR